MNTKIRLILVCMAFSFIQFGANGQKGKTAYLNSNELWGAMPEKASADSTLGLYREQLTSYLNDMVKTYQSKLTSLQNDSLIDQTSWLFQERVKELKEIETKISESKKKAENDIVKKRDELYKPIRKKMQSAINKVAKEEGYDYVIDESFGNILYVKSEDFNLLPLVKKELGL